MTYMLEERIDSCNLFSDFQTHTVASVHMYIEKFKNVVI